jgi:uncharacterized membrane protein YqgA involved in biofilm formation
MSTRASPQTRNRLIAIIGVAIIGVGITLGPYGLLVARETECVWEVCISNALIYGLGSVVTFVIGLWLLLEFWLRD